MGTSIATGNVQATITQNVSQGASIYVLPAKPEEVVRTLVQKCMTQTVVANTLYTLHTVTGGKVLYVTQITTSSNSAGVLRIGDNISGNTFTSGTVYSNCVVTNTNINTAVITF